MATIKELLATIKVGEPIKNKRILNYFKKRGFIWDYSQYGYLEGISLKDTLIFMPKIVILSGNENF